MSARPDIMPRIGLSTDQSVDSGSVLVMRFVLIAVLAGFAVTALIDGAHASLGDLIQKVIIAD